MVSFSDPHEIVNRFGEHILDFQRAFTTHNIPFGSQDDFCTLPRHIKSNLVFSNDLSYLVRALMEKESGNISLRMVLTIVAIASGGPEITRSSLDTSRSVTQVADFLIAAAGGTQIDADQMDCMYANAAPENEDEIACELSADEEESATHNTEQPSDSDRNVYGDRPFAASPSHEVTSAMQLNQSLARLELNSHEVKLYLDSIEQRISRMEPHVHGLPAREPARAEQSSRNASGTSRWAATTALEEQPERQTEPLPSPTPPPRAPHTTSSKKLTLWPVLLVPATLLAGAILYRNSGQHPAYTALRSSPSSANNATPQPDAASATPAPLTEPFASASPTPYAPLPAATTKGPAGKLNRHSEDATRDHPLDHPLAAKPSPTNRHSTPLETETEEADAAATASPDPDSKPPSYKTSYSADAASPSIPSTAPLSAKTVSVSSGVMAANLVSAPVPSYPRLATLTHMQGPVVMQAVISRDGTVEHLHVIKGHRLLRGSAMNAVKNWRYRPYRVNGRPVDVATIVTVDFNLKH